MLHRTTNVLKLALSLARLAQGTGIRTFHEHDTFCERLEQSAGDTCRVHHQATARWQLTKRASGLAIVSHFDAILAQRLTQGLIDFSRGDEKLRALRIDQGKRQELRIV